MGKKEKKITKNASGKSELASGEPAEQYFRGAESTYAIEVPFGETLDSVMDDWVAGWSDESYGPDGDGFTQGEGCEWTDERIVEFSVEISNRSWKALWTTLNAILQRMYREVREDMLRRECKSPCTPSELTWSQVSRGVYYQRRAKFREYPGGDVPHDYRPYVHYWYLVYKIKWKYTRKCTRS
jgi:hypothetical protein